MKRFTAIILSLSILYTAAPVSAEETDTTQETNTVLSASEGVEVSGVAISPDDPAWPEYRWQIANGGPGIKYWERVAKCETRSDWKDHGTWAGGLGIYTRKRFAQEGSGTWERWGGEEFGLRPQDATPLQQIVVANRIAMFGYRVTYRDWNGIHERVVQKTQYKKFAGFNGWGCIKQHRNGRQKGKWHINLNPSRFERNRNRYWRTDQPPYMTHEVVLHKMNIPKWAFNKYKGEPQRLR